MQTQPVFFVSHTLRHTHKAKSAAKQGNGPMCFCLAQPQGLGVVGWAQSLSLLTPEFVCKKFYIIFVKWRRFCSVTHQAVSSQRNNQLFSASD